MIAAPYEPFPPDALQHSAVVRFEQIASRYGDRIAFKTRETTLSYEQLNRRANRLAHALIRQRGEASEPVALLLSHDIWIAAAVFGVIKAGKFYAPLDPANPPARLKAVLDEIGADAIIADSRTREIAQGFAETHVIFVMDALDETLPDHNPGVTISPDAPLHLTFTSGTTGKPKGMVRTHSSVLANVIADADDYHFSPEDRMTLLTSYSFGGARKMLFGAWLNGGTLCAYDVRGDGFDDLERWLADEAITVFYATPSLFRHFAMTLKGQMDLPQLRLIIVSGETLHKHDVELYKQHFSDRCVLVNSVGATGVSAFCHYLIDKNTVIEGTVVPIGYPPAGTTIYLLDETGNAVPAGEIGEIAVKGRYVEPGFWRSETQNDTKYRLQPDGEYMFLTGDLGQFRPDGALLHLGRKDTQIKIRGQRVEPAEVESTLLTHHAIRAAVVTPFTLTTTAGSSSPEPMLIAYLVADPMPSLPTLRRFIGRHLPDYMIPVEFIGIDEIPLTNLGKIDNARLPRPTFEGVTGTLPTTPTELALVELIKPLVPVKTIYMENSFFELGGDSLRALRLLTAINRRFDTQLTPAALFHEPTLAQLAAHIERGAPSSSPLVALNPFGMRTPLVCVPGENGQAMHFSQLSSALGEDYPLYAFQHPRYDPRAPKFETLEALAQHYVTLTREALYGDPEFVVGASVGGIVAYEMAQQIAASGGQPPVVIMVDSYFNIPGRSRAWDEYTQQQRRQQRLNDPPMLTLRKWVYRLRRDLAKRFPSDPNERTTRRVKLETGRIAKPYIARPYAGKVFYLTCREDRRRQGHIERSDYLHWQELAQGGFELIDVPGDHLSVLEAPDVQTVAEHFRRIVAAKDESP